MKLITSFELAKRTTVELKVMFRLAAEGLARSAKNAPDRKAALGTMENIGRALSKRHLEP